MNTVMNGTRDELARVEQRIRELRQERGRLAKLKQSAVAAAEGESEEGGPAYETAKAASEQLREIERKLASEEERSRDLLRRVADSEVGVAGFSFPGVSGWADAARRLDLAHGEMRVDLAGGALLQRPMAAVNVQDFSGSGAGVVRVAATAPPQDRRFAYPALRQQLVDSGDLAVGGFTVSFTTTELELTGIERAPTATDPKAELDANVGWEQKDLRQFAITMDDVPVKILEAENQLRELLESEMRYRLDLALDAHVISAIQAAAPPAGLTGTTMVEQVRNAVAGSRALGANPSVLLLSPADAAALDLTTTGADGMFVFAVRDTGSASPLWSLVIRESESVSDPTLLDPAILGPLFVGTGTVLVDPYSSMERNVVRLRVEIEALCFVRDARGAYVIA
jgi:hypothetical protein